MTLAPALAPAGAAPSCSTLLASAYRRLSALCDALCLELAEPRAPAGQGWIDGAELASRPELLDAFLDEEDRRIRERYAVTARPDVVASRALHGLLWSAALLMSGPWYLERRVPRLRPAQFLLRRTGNGCAVVPGGFSCLPDDPAAGCPGSAWCPDRSRCARSCGRRSPTTCGRSSPRSGRGHAGGRGRCGAW
ncbi:hypothetical protein [Streptomyces clavuligerus]|uniref:hypothetical protein n=1 Tax=Streptomyces clavuligerus TaxID=1901 RepID=UPI0039C68D28